MPDTHPLSRPLSDVAAALRAGEVSSVELLDEALSLQASGGLHAYKLVDPVGARRAARAADRRLADEAEPPAMCGVPVSVKDLYGVDGLPTFAGSARRLPDTWSRDAWLVARLRAQGAVFVGKTHTVEFAYGGVGINPHWGTPWNPWDARTHRIPGGSSCGAGVSLVEGSALVALGSDTGGSVRIPASFTGTVGHRTTGGRWPTDGVVPLSARLDTVGGLTRTVADSAYFFGAIDAAWDGPEPLLAELEGLAGKRLRVVVPRCDIWSECQSDVADVLHATLEELAAGGWAAREGDGALLDDARHLYIDGGIGGAECRAFLAEELPEWLELLHPTVGDRLAVSLGLDDPRYAQAVTERDRLMPLADALFADADVLALPAAMITPPPVRDLAALDAYLEVNAATLRPTCPASILGLTALTLPAGLDAAGMPVGLQLVAPGGRDELLLAAALAAERALGTATERLGEPPLRPGGP